MWFCKECGAEVREGDRFCKKCGKPVDNYGGDSGSCDTDGSPDFPGWWDWWAPGHVGGWIKRWQWVWSPAWIMVNAVLLGTFVVLLGILLLLSAVGIAPLFGWNTFWAYLLIGTGCLLLIRCYARLKVAGRIVWHGDAMAGAILVILGLANLAMIAAGLGQHTWVLIFLAIGLLIIAGGVSNYLFMKSWRHREK